MTNKDTIQNFLSNNNQPFCDDCLSEELGIQPRQQINSICRRLFSENEIYRLKSRCVQCNKEKIVNCYFLMKINNYNEAYAKLCDILPRIDFNETLKIIKKIDSKLQNGENPTEIIKAVPDVIKADFLENTDSDLIAYNIIKKLWWDWGKLKYNKSKKFSNKPSISFKYFLIDGNLGVIKDLFEESKKKDKENQEIRVYILLFGMILLEQIVMEYSDKLFGNLLQGKFDTKGELRNYLIANYFKISTIEPTNYKYKKYRPDLTKLRNTLAHGSFITRNEKIYLYHEKNKPPEVFNFQKIVDIFDIIMVKFTFMDIYYVLMFYLAIAEEKAMTNAEL